MVSIIILAYQNNYLTVRCLDSIRAHTKEKYELIVVDNGSRLELEQDRYPQLKLIRNSFNQGFARGCNQGAWVAEGEYLLFLNNDTIVTPDWLTSMVQVLEKPGQIGIVGSKLLFPDSGRIQHAGVIFINRLPGPIYYQQDPAQVPIDQETEYPAVTGAGLLIWHHLFYRIGGFDPRFLNSYEDVDLCLKVRQLGYRVIYTPKSLVYHYGSRSPDRHRHDRRNLLLLLQKWKDCRLLE